MSDASAPSPSPTQPPAGAAPGAAPLPRTFGEYLRSFGPGIVVVLTWLGAGDIIDMGVAGANYGYSLMWVLVAALLFRISSSACWRDTTSATSTAKRCSTAWCACTAGTPLALSWPRW